MTGGCYFCDEQHRIEEHHIVPRRFGGGDSEENIVRVCPTCHSKLESLYDKRFYDELAVEQGDGPQMPMCDLCGDNRADGQHINGLRGLQSRFCCEQCAEENDLRLSFNS